MFKKLLVSLLLVTALFGRNDVKSCYKALNIEAPKADTTELFIILDQTTELDKKMKKYIYLNMKHFLMAGNKISIATFSSNTNGKYTEVLFSGKLDHKLENTYDISKKVLRKYDNCMKSQYKYMKNKATKSLITAIKGIDGDIPKSDIFKSLNDLSKHLVNSSTSKNKVVLLVSDMMEYSTITSFYSKGTLKKINTDKEMAKLKSSGYLADFDNAKVYVVGAGLGPKNSYRDPLILKSFKSFWTEYFKESNGNLIELGLPMLLEDLEVN